jgi:hypothetical protein
VEIAKQEAVTVHKGGQTGNQNAAKDKDKTNNRITINRSSNHPDTNQGILRRLAKQGRDDLLERVAIAKAIEEEIGNRQGKRTDLELVGDCPQVTADKTRAIAAEKAGFGSEVTYRRAKAVVPSISRTTADMSSFHLNSRLFRFSQNQSFDPVG